MRIAVLVSGSGTNLQALIDAERAGRLAPAALALVVSNRPGVGALERATAAGLPTAVVDHTAFATRDAFDAALLAVLADARIDAVVLAGFMRVLGAGFVAAYAGRIVNTHPALCPAFPGVDAARRALDHGVKLTGCTVHFVDAGVDTGPIIAQAAVEIREDDDAAALQGRIQREEHRLLPEAVQRLAAGRLVLDGRRVRVAEAV